MKLKAAIVSVVALSTLLAWTSRASADSTMTSDQNLRYTRAYIERSLDMLSHDQSDYGGHRVAAIGDLNTAKADLTSALQFDKNPDDRVVPTDVRSQDTDIAAIMRGQFASNENLEHTRTIVARSIALLQQDAHDYGGYRVKAIAALGATRDQLTDALQYFSAHGGGMMGGGASDDNLRYSRLYLNRAVDMLQHDAHDYQGHRAAAVTDIQRAQADLAYALEHDTNRDRDTVLPAHAAPGDEDLDAYYLRHQFNSDQNISYVSRYVERAIDMLQKDQHDYAGFRAKAVENLVAARQQLSLALTVH
ncbi:MAG TPA: hypothetical protein VID24_09285 [Candidatus Eremiobacteraceae bacterium]